MACVTVRRAAQIMLPDEARQRLGVSEDDYLFTGDDDMLVLAEREGIRIVTPQQLLNLLESGTGEGEGRERAGDRR